MALTAQQVGDIDSALGVLAASLKDELAKFPAAGKAANYDDAFLKKIADCYLTQRGVLSLLADSRLQRGTNCLCGCSCAEPSKGIVTW